MWTVLFAEHAGYPDLLSCRDFPNRSDAEFYAIYLATNGSPEARVVPYDANRYAPVTMGTLPRS